MVFYVNKASPVSRFHSPSQNSLLQFNHGYHIEPGTREKALLREDPILKQFKSPKRNVRGLKRMGEVFTLVVIAGCCYQIYVKSVMREEARKAAQKYK